MLPYRRALGQVSRNLDRMSAKVRALSSDSEVAPHAAPDPAADAAPEAAPDRPASRGGASVWFWEHYETAAKEIVDFFAGDHIDLRGKRVADIGCGDGILDAGLAALTQPESLVGFDVNLTDVSFLRKELEAEGLGPVLPPSLSFRESEPVALPAEDAEFNVAVTWSAFEHIRDPIPVLREVRRILKPHGVLMLQLWPFYFSQHGSHLMDWFPEGFAHLLRPPPAVEDDVRGRAITNHEWVEYMLREFGTLNRITVDELQQSLLAGGFCVSKFELISNAVHVPPELSRYPLSELGISGIKLLATPRLH